MNTRLIKVSKVVFDVWFWFALVGVVALVAVAPFVTTIMDAILENVDRQVSTGFLGATVELNLDGLDEETVTNLSWAVIAMLASGLAVSVYVVHQIRRALRSVLEGRAFKMENEGRLRRMAYAIFSLVPIGWITGTWADSVVNGHFSPNLDPQLGAIAAGLLALSIAEIYKAGVTLADEAELTV